MNAAILCPGPSLAAFFEPLPEPPDVRIAVNRAALMVGACEWWVALDVNTAPWAREIASPPGATLVCSTSAFRKACRYGPALRAVRHFDVREIAFPLSPVRWSSWSWAAAVALACHLGADRVRCYGMDWQGTRDMDGYSDGRQRRTFDRWGLERRLFGEMAGACAGRGVRLHRVLAGEGVTA